jgi:predicted N-acetyltransferase YhbS
MYIEEITENDLDQLHSLQPEGWSDIVPEFRTYLREDYCFPVKVVAGNKIVGTGAAISFGVTGWLAHIIVEPRYRNKGIGCQIVTELLKILRDQGALTFLLVATELGRPVYLRAGFRPVTDYTFMKRESQWKGYPVSPKIIPYKKQFYRELLDMDLAIFGENREKLLRDKLHSAYLYLENGNLEGYYIPGISEGPIAALNSGAGLELMNLKYGMADKAVFPADNKHACDFLGDNGFTVTKTIGTRMIMGADIPWRPENIYSRIAGNLG